MGGWGGSRILDRYIMTTGTLYPLHLPRIFASCLQDVQNIGQVYHHGLQGAAVAIFVFFEKEVIFHGYGTQTYCMLVVFI